MGEIRLEEKEGGRMLTAEGRLGIQDASVLKNFLVEAYQAGNALLVDLTRAESVDLACAQVLCSARDTFEEAKKTLRLVGELQEGVIRSWNDMAIDPFGRDSGFGRES